MQTAFRRSWAKANHRVARSSTRANPEFDVAALRASLEAVRQTLGRYFRRTVYGGENIPAGGCMVVGCHSGVVPYDAALAGTCAEERIAITADRAAGRARTAGGHEGVFSRGPEQHASDQDQP